MPDASHAIRLEEFRARPLHWIVVHHLLSADLLRELVAAIVEVASDGRLGLQDLFEDLAPTGPPATSSWFIATRATEAPFADFLSRFVMTIVWQGDDAPSPPHDGIDEREASWVRNLIGAFELSAAGLDGAPDSSGGEGPQSIDAVRTALAAARHTVRRKGVGTEADDQPDLLKALLTKHLGDLDADVDNWKGAHAQYSAAEALLTEEAGWEDAAQTTLDVIAQSIAMATWHVSGPEAAAPLLEALVERTSLDVAPLATINARFDLMNAKLARGSFSTAWPDRRAADCLAPLVIHSHNLDNAMTYASVGRYRQAHRWFWATLRRQTALGGTVAAWTTKAHYGRSIVDELETLLGRQNLPSHFMLAIRMLIESGRTELVEKTDWSGPLVEAYVDDDVLDELGEIVARSPGTAHERTLAATALRREWLLALPGDREELARRLLSELAKAARTGAHTGFASTNTGGLALKALKAVGRERPEFRNLAGPGIVELLDDLLAEHGAITVSEAVETAVQFVDGVDPQSARALCQAVIDLVGRLPQGAAWPVTHAATRLLGSDAAARLVRDDNTFRRERSVALVKLALNSAQENTGLLYVLRDVDPSVVESQIDAQGLTAIVDGIRKRAVDPSSSAATGAIHALLVAPKVAGPDGVADALRGIDLILRSAGSLRSSPSLQDSYEVLLLLARHGDAIATDLGQPSWFAEQARALLEPLREMWLVAASRPLIFAGFAIPPLSVPNRVAVHNWTFATLEFAKWLGASDELAPALDAAAANSDLAEGMSVAQAMQGTAAAAIDPVAVAKERADTFYAALGERLAGVGPRTDGDAAADVGILLDRCIEVGPRGEDAALLFAAWRLGIRRDPDEPAVGAYTAKLRNDPKLRLSVSPLLNCVLAQAS